MRIRLNLVAGAAAAALALTACGSAAGTSGGTQKDHAASVSARHAQTDTGFTDLRDLARVKRDTAWKAVDPGAARQPQLDTSGSAESADLRDLARLKREASWRAAEHARGG
jgi:hypothetical protein